MKTKIAYYYLDEDSQQIGPLSMEKLLKMKQSGIITDETLVWTEGLDKWVPLSSQIPSRVPHFKKNILPSGKDHSLVNTENEQSSSSCKPGKRKKIVLIVGLTTMCLLLGGALLLPDTAFSRLDKIKQSAQEKQRKNKAISQEEAFNELKEFGIVSSILDIEGKVGQEALESAAKQGNFKIVKLLIAGGTPINSTFALAAACSSGRGDIVGFFLKIPGIDVNKGDPLNNAVQNMNLEAVKHLVSRPELIVRHSVLLNAVRKNNEELINLLTTAKIIEINTNDSETTPVLFEAVEKGNPNIVKMLLKIPGIDVNFKVYPYDHYTKITLLSFAAMKGKTEIVKSLSAVPGINLNQDDPISEALLNGHEEIAKILLECPEIKVSSRAISIAISKKHTEFLKVVFSSHKGKIADDSYDYALQTAIDQSDTQMVKILLNEAKIDLTKRDNSNSPLEIATREGQTEIVKSLLSAAQKINLNLKQDRALAIAAENGHIEIAKLLLKEPEIDVNRDGPLYHAAEKGHIEMVKLLLSVPGVNVNAHDDDSPIIHEHGFVVDPLYKNRSPLTAAAGGGHLEIVKLLLNTQGVKLTPQAGGALWMAAAGGHEETVKLLLTLPKINVNTQDCRNMTPLCVAARNGHIKIVKILLKVPGIHINEGSPLSEAAMNNQVETVKLLLKDPGIDITTGNKQGLTPLNAARTNGNSDIINMIEKALLKKYPYMRLN